jgi:hypothetical protein
MQSSKNTQSEALIAGLSGGFCDVSVKGGKRDRESGGSYGVVMKAGRFRVKVEGPLGGRLMFS